MSRARTFTPEERELLRMGAVLAMTIADRFGTGAPPDAITTLAADLDGDDEALARALEAALRWIEDGWTQPYRRPWHVLTTPGASVGFTPTASTPSLHN